jgi:hypothetical protein
MSPLWSNVRYRFVDDGHPGYCSGSLDRDIKWVMISLCGVIAILAGLLAYCAPVPWLWAAVIVAAGVLAVAVWRD